MSLNLFALYHILLNKALCFMECNYVGSKDLDPNQSYLRIPLYVCTVCTVCTVCVQCIYFYCVTYVHFSL